MNIKEAIAINANSETIEILRMIGSEVEKSSAGAWLVGGAARDAAMGVAIKDVDVAIEGNAQGLARDIAAATGGKYIHKHGFGTASVEFENGSSVDFATARSEYYPKPGALPVVSASSIQKDLERRDFSINAMAASLREKDFGDLLDPFNGLADLEKKQLRILHDLSFRDDPTRIFRGARFAARFGFDFDPHTAELLQDALKMGAMKTVSAARIRKEIQLAASEDNPAAVVEILNSLGATESMAAGFRFNADMLRKISPDNWQGFIAAAAFENDAAPVEKMREFLAADKSDLRILDACAGPAVAGLLESLERAESASAARDVLKNVPVEAVACLKEAGAGNARKKANAFLETRNISLEVSGDDLLALGYEKNAALGMALQKLLEMKLDGLIIGREQELSAAKEMMMK